MSGTMNQEELKNLIESFKSSKTDGISSDGNKRWRELAKQYHDEYDADFIRNASVDELYSFLSGLYSFKPHYIGTESVIKEKIETNIDQVKEGLLSIVQCERSGVAKVWDAARSSEVLKSIAVGPGCISEILMYNNPKEFALFNGSSNPGFEKLGFGYHRDFKDGKQYLDLCDQLRNYLPTLQSLDSEMTDLMDFEMFAQFLTKQQTPDYLAISEFEQKYKGQPYRKSDPDYETKKKEGKRAFQEINKLRDEICGRFDLVEDKDASWQNSGSIIPVYYRFKRPGREDSPISIALYIDSLDGSESKLKHGKYCVNYQVRHDDVQEGKDEEVYERFFKGFKDFPKIGNGLEYTVCSGNDRWERIGENSKTNLTLKDLKAEDNHGANIGLTIPGDGITNDELRDKIESAVENLLYYYDLAFENANEVSTPEGGKEKVSALTKDEWLKILNNPNIIGPVWGGLLAAFYSYPNGATCTQVGEKYHRDPRSISSTAVQLAKCVRREINYQTSATNDAGSVVAILFSSRDAKDGEKGDVAWELVPSLREALADFGIARFEWPTEESHPLREKMEAGLLSYNTIFYGVPGCGKSYHVKELVAGMPEEDVFRITFYPDYSNADFIGQILPKLTEKKEVYFDFAEGPFSKALKRAMEHPEVDVALIVEEINRGNAAAIFGDIFQILDRKANGSSEYPITNANLAKIVFGDEDENVLLPSNFYLIATMNTSDQNVFPLDTAFKRRWSMECIPNGKADFGDDSYVPLTGPDGKRISWNAFKDKVNGIIDDNQNGINSADKKIGAYFVLKGDLIDSPDGVDPAYQIKAKHFAAKIFQYLYGDVFAMNRSRVFRMGSLEDLLERFSLNDPVRWIDVFVDPFE